MASNGRHSLDISKEDRLGCYVIPKIPDPTVVLKRAKQRQRKWATDPSSMQYKTKLNQATVTNVAKANRKTIARLKKLRDKKTQLVGVEVVNPEKQIESNNPAPKVQFCFKHPTIPLPSGQQICWKCRHLKCTYCKHPIQLANKKIKCTVALCRNCQNNSKKFGPPFRACKYCTEYSVFYGNTCQRCYNARRRYGNPYRCEQCEKNCAFKNVQHTKIERILCALCTIYNKRCKDTTAVTRNKF